MASAVVGPQGGRIVDRQRLRPFDPDAGKDDDLAWWQRLADGRRLNCPVRRIEVNDRSHATVHRPRSAGPLGQRIPADTGFISGDQG
jgi:hypothetical protein